MGETYLFALICLNDFSSKMIGAEKLYFSTSCCIEAAVKSFAETTEFASYSRQ